MRRPAEWRGGKILKSLLLPAYESAAATPRVCVMKLRCIFATLLLFAALGPAYSAPLGESAYRSGDYPRASRRIGPAAERGDARAQAYLGFMYQYGRGVPQSYVQAYAWCELAEINGNADATLCRDAALESIPDADREKAFRLVVELRDRQRTNR